MSYQQAIAIVIVIYYTAHGLLNSESISAVFVRCSNTALDRACKLASILPRKRVCAAVVVAERIANIVVCYGCAIIRRKLVEPRGISICIWRNALYKLESLVIVCKYIRNITVIIVVILVCYTLVMQYFKRKLSLIVISVFTENSSSERHRKDIAYLIIRIRRGVRYSTDDVRSEIAHQHGRAAAGKRGI